MNIWEVKREFVKVSSMFFPNKEIVLLSMFFVNILRTWKISHGICKKFKIWLKKENLGAIPESFKKINLHPHLLHVTPNERIYALLWLHDRTS